MKVLVKALTTILVISGSNRLIKKKTMCLSSTVQAGLCCSEGCHRASGGSEGGSDSQFTTRKHSAHDKPQIERGEPKAMPRTPTHCCRVSTHTFTQAITVTIKSVYHLGSFMYLYYCN